MEFVKSLWRGEKSLTFTFWIMGIIVALIVSVFDVLLFQYVSDFFLNFPLSLTYALFILVCIWRSANAYIQVAKDSGNAKSIWGYLAKIMAVIGVIKPIVMIAFNSTH